MPDVMATPSQETGSQRIGPRRWRKHALPFTTFKYSKGGVDKTVTVDKVFAERLKANFDNKVRDIVPVPARGAGGHSDDWRDNKGDTIGLEVHPEKGIYVTVEVDEEADTAIAEEKLRGVSLAFDENWFDPVAQEFCGPVLRHTALTNVPFIKGTDEFERIALSEPDDTLIMLAELPPAPKEDPPMDLKAIIKALKEEHKIDFDELKAKAEKHDEAVTKAVEGEKKAKQAEGVRAALAGAGVELSEADGEPDIISAVKGLVSTKTELSEQVGKLTTTVEGMQTAAKKEKALRLVTPYAKAGLVAETERETWISLAETNPELAEASLKGLSKGVLLTEIGSEFSEDPPPTGSNGDVELSEDDAKEVERISKAYVIPAPAA